ncbi:MAG: alpha/beta fold hydrolase [Patescibacteria group bacterium]
MKKTFIAVCLILLIYAVGSRLLIKPAPTLPGNTGTDNQNNEGGELNVSLDPLTINNLRQGSYPGSEMLIEETLESGINYKRYIASYKSENLQIFGLLTVPESKMPASGWPVIVFNHGYIPPNQYRTTEKYVAYVDGFARSGYIVFKPDYRGHGNSEGEPSGAYGSNGYVIDVLNAVASVKKLKNADANRIGMWGHSLGGFITLRAMVVSKDVKAGVIWAGVVGSYPDLLNHWRRPGIRPVPLPSSGSRRWRQALVETYGQPEANPEFWNSISATAYLADISGPLQLHHGTGDESVPYEFSQKLELLMKAAGKEVEYHEYEGDDHNLSRSFSTAMKRSVEFYDRYLK